MRKINSKCIPIICELDKRCLGSFTSPRSHPSSTSFRSNISHRSCSSTPNQPSISESLFFTSTDWVKWTDEQIAILIEQ
jgi:hypothetical protein